MEQGKTTRVIAIAALIIAVIGLAVGFSAFSNDLTISSTANVKPDDTLLNVDFSSSNTELATSAITPSLNVEATGFTATDATIDNSTKNAPKISNLSATFTEPGQKAVYTFYTRNVGQLEAFLKSVSYTGTKTCTAETGTTQGLVDSACTGITSKVSVAGTTYDTTKTSITSHSLSKDASEIVTVTLEYAAGSSQADGDFTVEFSDIVLTYSSVD